SSQPCATDRHRLLSQSARCGIFSNGIVALSALIQRLHDPLPAERDERLMAEIENTENQEESLKYESESWEPDWYKTNIPCQVGCPAHTDVSTYIGLISQGRFDEAYLLNRTAYVVPG